MDQNLVKEAIHLHLLFAMSDAGILRHAVFQGGTALRLCYGGDRYSGDLYFVCAKAGSYFTHVEFKELIESALETTKKAAWSRLRHCRRSGLAEEAAASGSGQTGADHRRRLANHRPHRSDAAHTKIAHQDRIRERSRGPGSRAPSRQNVSAIRR